MKATYTIDPAHSNLQFSIRHLMITNVRGTFTGVKGAVVYDPDAPETSSVEAEIDANTLNTQDATRDGHVKSGDFLDVAQYPTITFKSTSVKRSGDGLKVEGNLTLHGVTKPVTLDVEEVGAESKDLYGNLRIGASAKGKIKRSDFGVVWNAPLETGGVALSDDLKLDFEVQMIKQASSSSSAAS